MASTNADLLITARGALSAILAGENAGYSVMGRSFTKHNVKDLWALIQGLENAVAADTGNGSGLLTTMAFPTPLGRVPTLTNTMGSGN